jgi:hypothetical protein
VMVSYVSTARGAVGTVILTPCSRSVLYFMGSNQATDQNTKTLRV